MSAAIKSQFDMPDMADGDLKVAVTEELNRLVSHDLLKDTTRMKRFLTFIVKETLEGRGRLLKGYTVGLEVFDRPEDFDPQADTIVRVQAGQLRRRLDLIYGTDKVQTPVRILVPKGQYAPVFEMRSDVESLEPVSLLKVVEAQQDTPDTTKASHLSRPGVAVMTLENLTAEPETDFFAEGLTAELINALVQFRYLRIVALTPTVTSHASDADLKKLGERYNVQFFLSGSVRRSGDVFRVSVNLLSADTGEHVFSKILDRQYEAPNLFDVQEEIASHTAAAIGAPFGAINRYNRRSNVKSRRTIPVYEAILKYYSMALNPTPEKAQQLLQEFEVLSKKEPDYSSVWAIMAILNCFLATQPWGPRDVKSRLENALKYATKSAAIDPQNALSYFALFQAYFHMGKLKTADKMAEKALRLNPNDDAMLAYYSIVAAYAGDHQKSLALLDAATRLNARPPKWFYLSSLFCTFSIGKYEDVCEILGEINHDQISAVTMVHLASLGHLGRAKEYEPFVESMLKKYPNFREDCLEIMGLWNTHEGLQSLILDGWDRAGLSA